MRLLRPNAFGCLLLVVFAALALAVPRGAALADAGRKLPAKFKRSPYSLMSLSVGYPNAGWQVRAKKLRPKPDLRIKRGSGRHLYGHPALVLMLSRSARAVARAVPGAVMLVGDLSRAGGGPLAGHASHQSGRDADVAFFVRDARGRPVVPDRFIRFGSDGKALDGSGLRFDDRSNWLVVKSWVSDERAGLSHIFVSRALRQRLLAYAQRDPRYRSYVQKASVLLKQPEDSTSHDDHFHVRISCPKRQAEICREESK